MEFFLQLKMFDACTMRIFKFWPHKRQHGFIDIFHLLQSSVPLVLTAQIIVEVKNIDAPMLTRVATT
jgi:hypothetical protein